MDFLVVKIITISHKCRQESRKIVTKHIYIYVDVDVDVDVDR